MRRFFSGLVVAFVFVLPVLAGDKPNIVLIISDDQGWTDYGFMGHEVIRTPHLDALAARSLVFKRGYVTAPLCRPSLASMMSGLYPRDHGVPGNDVDGGNNRAALSAPVTERFNELPSMAKSLVEAGYLAHQSGKWWEGSYTDGGFTHGMTHGDARRGGRHGDVGLLIGRRPAGAERASEGSDIEGSMRPIAEFMDHALEQEQPFFLWYAPFLPHTPHNPPQRLLQKYTAPGRPADVAKYYAMCEWFDETCGELVRLIDDRGLRENTVLLYICDNGWATRSSNAADPNQERWDGFALRSKGSPFEMGIRTPIMVSWPGKIQPGQSDDFASAIDLFPTACAAAGIEPPETLPGVNLLDREATAQRDIIFGVTHAIHNMTPNEPDGTLQYLWAIEGDYKLLVRYTGENYTQYARIHDWDKVSMRLYDVAADPHEQTNLVADPALAKAQHLEIAQRMLVRISEWHTPDIPRLMDRPAPASDRP
ncbi:MAG: sulfatase [Planctomycetota bacterium]